MNTNLFPSLRRSVSAALLVLPLLACSLAAGPAAADRAAEILATQGTLPVAAAGRYVEIGTFRVQVTAKLGRPDVTLPDGTWLYHGRKTENSTAQGTLVIRFNGGRVSALGLATPATVAALRADPRKATPQELVAAK